MNAIETVLNFIKTGESLKHDTVFYNETRDQSQARVIKWIDYFKKIGLIENDCIILGAILGEITNNSFDHNLGLWKDKTGCAVGLEANADSQSLQIIIADRGQGIISSLSRSVQNTEKPAAILKKAFHERISGRAPEKRGNGLKFVVKHILQKNAYLNCITQGESITFGQSKLNFTSESQILPKNFSTLIYIEWSII